MLSLRAQRSHRKCWLSRTSSRLVHTQTVELMLCWAMGCSVCVSCRLMRLAADTWARGAIRTMRLKVYFNEYELSPISIPTDMRKRVCLNVCLSSGWCVYVPLKLTIKYELHIGLKWREIMFILLVYVSCVFAVCLATICASYVEWYEISNVCWRWYRSVMCGLFVILSWIIFCVYVYHSYQERETESLCVCVVFGRDYANTTISYRNLMWKLYESLFLSWHGRDVRMQTRVYRQTEINLYRIYLYII